MPVHHGLPKEGMIYQRDQYQKGGIGRWYWDFKDNLALSQILPEHHRILDLGCGEGLILERLKKAFPQRTVIGIDLEPENIAICKEHDLTALHMDACCLAFRPNSFDACVCVDVFEHFPRPLEAIREVHRILKVGGILILMVPHDRNFFLARMAMGRIKDAFYDAGHVNQWSPNALEGLLAREGFAVTFRRSIPFLLWQTSLHYVVVAVKDRRH